MLPNGKLRLKTKQKDATLLWRYADGEEWKIYSTSISIQQGTTVGFIANRIGFDSSPIASYSIP